MRESRPPVFKERHFEPEIIILCVRRYLRFSLSYRNLEELMAERNVALDHVTVWRWVQHYAPELDRRCRRKLRMTNRSWRVDETYIQLRRTGDLGRRCRCRPIRYLNNIVEQDHRTVKRRVRASQGFQPSGS